MGQSGKKSQNFFQKKKIEFMNWKNKMGKCSHSLTFIVSEINDERNGQDCIYATYLYIYPAPAPTWRRPSPTQALLAACALQILTERCPFFRPQIGSFPESKKRVSRSFFSPYFIRYIVSRQPQAPASPNFACSFLTILCGHFYL